MFGKEIRHKGLNAYRYIRGADLRVVEQKAEAQMMAWEARWQKKVAAERKQTTKAEKKQQADERTEHAQAELKGIENTLLTGLRSSQPASWWATLHDTAPFSLPQPVRPTSPSVRVRPLKMDAVYKPSLGLFDFLFPSLKRQKIAAAEGHFQADEQKWRAERTEAEQSHAAGLKAFAGALAAWNEEREDYLAQQERTNAGIAEREREYRQQKAGAVEDYCDIVLSPSVYPDDFPRDVSVAYVVESRLLVVEYALPSPEAVPRLKEIRYIASRDEFSVGELSDATWRKMYDGLLYQISLRSLYELFRADVADALDAVVFNGWLRSIDRASGVETTACILSVQAGKADLQLINLAQVDPKACFKKLKGVGGASLSDLTPIRPILQINREDKRFVAAHSVAGTLDEGTNLAAMDWEEFEHLIREIFEKEFSQNGGEVKITRASRDAGVDAVAFDPDPIRGGKIVIQAKRYTNTVGVSAVRDLYGTVMNEGANKGILVTTADYGPDAYAFAKDKPLTLLNGSELLFLLQKHGHRSRIDLLEAKAILGERERYR